MINVRLDYGSSLRMRWPCSDRTIILLGENYVAYESSLPPEEQVLAPSLTLMQTTLTAAKEEADLVQSGEKMRFTAASQYKGKLTKAKTNLRQATIHLKSMYADRWHELNQWGLLLGNTQRGIGVRLPNRNRDWEAYLYTYVAKEASLPAEEQLSNPPLADMQALAQELRAAKKARDEQRNQREASVQARSRNVQRLYELLQVAAMVITVTQHEGIADNKLQQWGYVVVNPQADPPFEGPKKALPVAAMS